MSILNGDSLEAIVTLPYYIRCKAAKPIIEGKQPDAFVAGNDEEALKTVGDLVKTIGFYFIVAGMLTVCKTLAHAAIADTTWAQK